MDNSPLKYWLGLSLVSGLGPRYFDYLVTEFGNPEQVWEASLREVRKAGLPDSVLRSFADVRKDLDLEKELEKVFNLGLQIVTKEDESYPANLSLTERPPFLIFVKGGLSEADALSLAVVGTRKYSGYGKRVTKDLVRQLGSAEVTIVSGLASGIDSFAHQETLAVGGRTLAVLGHGLDQIYPPQNAPLADKILEAGGALISEYPPGFPPVAGNFPARNRIISGLSLGTLVCEAPERSGALITASCAAEQGRSVFVVPGSIYNSGYVGCARLIQDGAQLVIGARDILQDSAFVRVRESLETISFSRGKGESLDTLRLQTEEEEKIFAELKSATGAGLTTDQISRKVGMPVSVVLSTLTELEVKGLAEEVTEGKWVVGNG